MNETNNDRLWRLAHKRAEFKKSLYSYITINIFLWLLWWFTAGRVTGFTGIPWPVWVMLGWGLSLAKQYFEAYAGNKKDLAEEEYQKLKREEEMNEKF